ncbi:MAG TPA: hypothetical protein VHE23_00430 [Candidatus Acidoferrales bacterium]|nr:hypothetical protein [Candidatus Acidoferrales bacterium]
MKQLLAQWKLLLAAAGIAAAALAAISYSFLRHPVSPEEVERRRRLHLNQIGRIADGQVVELVEQPAEPAASRGGFLRAKARPRVGGEGRKLVSYSYSISGVIYQTAQDITGLDSQAHFEELVAGQPASVKYDPGNPSDSILVADDWSGLR